MSLNVSGTPGSADKPGNVIVTSKGSLPNTVVYTDQVNTFAAVNILNPIADPAAGQGKYWLSSTNIDVLKYSNTTTLFNILSTKGVTGTFTSAAPAGTTSATAVMMAAGAATITPATSTRVMIVITGQMSNSGLNDGATVDLRISAVGNQTAPVNGAAVSGNLIGISQNYTALLAAAKDGFALSGIATGLTIGQAYWIDLSLLATVAGTATVTGVTISVHEI